MSATFKNIKRVKINDVEGKIGNCFVYNLSVGSIFLNNCFFTYFFTFRVHSDTNFIFSDTNFILGINFYVSTFRNSKIATYIEALFNKSSIRMLFPINKYQIWMYFSFLLVIICYFL